jgi:hypothetical protein
MDCPPSLPLEMKFDEVNLSRGRRILNFSKPPVEIWAVALRFGWSAMNNQITFNRTQMTQIEQIFADFLRI